MALRIYHFASGTPGLVQAVDDIASLSGVRASAGGYEGRTRNALASLGERLNLAIDTPHCRKAALLRSTLSGYACETDNIQREKTILDGLGYAAKIVTKHRIKTDGEIVVTRAIDVIKQPFGIGLPLIMQLDPLS